MFRFGYSSGHRPFLDLMITFKKERAHSKPRILDQTTIIEKSESEERSEVGLGWLGSLVNDHETQIKIKVLFEVKGKSFVYQTNKK